MKTMRSILAALLCLLLIPACTTLSPSPEAATDAPPSPTPADTPSAETPPEQSAAPGTVPAITMEELPSPASFERMVEPPDLLTMFDGTPVTTAEQWALRREEIKNLLQRYMYGIWRDGSEENLRYTIDGNTILITIEKDGKEASFTALYTKPSTAAPEGGYPVIVAVGGMAPDSYIADSGYAVISYNPGDIASDNAVHGGIFYKLYPYDSLDWREQTGVVMAWAWGASKIAQVLEQGAGAELGISAENTIVTGISRYGKAAAAAGAFEDRFRVSMPVCSGYGGLTMGRYGSNGITYNLLSDFAGDPKQNNVSDLSAWKSTGGNEGLGGLQGSGWFTEAFKGFATYQHLPLDAHFIAALSAAEGRYLFAVTGINSDMWNSPPGLWYCVEQAKPAFTLLGLDANLAIQTHLDLHGIETVDLVKLFAFTGTHFYGQDFNTADFPAPWDSLLAGFTLEDLQTCVFASEANREAYLEGMPADPALIPDNPENIVPFSLMLGDEVLQTTVGRSLISDALVSPLEGAEEGTGFRFRYGAEKQYGSSYARFTLTLPEGKTLSDYASLSFTCQTDANYFGKKMALVVMPAEEGLPEDIAYDYGTDVISNAISLSGGLFFPVNTATPQTITLPITDAAEGIEGSVFECSIYIHMEHVDGSAEYTLRDIVFQLR